jgi:hypothetical protein
MKDIVCYFRETSVQLLQDVKPHVGLLHTHTHTHTHIYIHMCVCVCVCVTLKVGGSSCSVAVCDKSAESVSHIGLF